MSDFYLHEGNRYIVKNQKGLKIALAIAFAAMGVYAYFQHESSLRGIIVALVLFAIAGVMLATLRIKMVFDLDKRIFYIQNGGGKTTYNQSLDNFAGLELIRQSRFFGLLRNSTVTVVFNVDGKTSKMPIRQFGPGQKAPQAMMEETENFLGIRQRGDA